MMIIDATRVDLPDQKVQCLENPSKISGKSGFSNAFHVKLFEQISEKSHRPNVHF